MTRVKDEKKYIFRAKGSTRRVKKERNEKNDTKT